MPDPVSGILGGVQFLTGGIQALIGGRKARRAQAELEGLQTPTTTSDPAIANYYNQASANPYDTAFYQNQKRSIQSGTAQGLSALQDRRSALLGVNSLVRNQNNALLNAGAQAEQQQKSMLGNAVRMKAADNQRLFDINQMLPYQKKFSLLAQKAAAANQTVNSGLSNMFGGLQTGLLGGLTSGAGNSGMYNSMGY